MSPRRMRFFTSPPTLVSDVMAWANKLFGGRIPTLPLPPSWAESLTRLWSTAIVGSLPDPSSPKPWRIKVDGEWRPFSSCDATFTEIEIDIADRSTKSQSHKSSPKPRSTR